MYHNGTGAPPSDGWIVPDKFVLVNLTGTQYNPVKDVHLSNVKYTASGATYVVFECEAREFQSNYSFLVSREYHLKHSKLTRITHL